nr:DNA polymerase III subunit gamma and tau [Microbacterium sp. SYP-A9085]
MYRRYRPETFAEMIGQAQVTEPLMTALRGDRVGHAYLFSGPRGCGKTTSARILARCLNCAQGPTDTPCGTCDSCIELGRGGGGSLDVVEIDAASHNGVDDARDLRERAVFAPARDRFKIFILDEAHMVTPQGFNALLKLVEEPPDHVKFIFATTEPEKVIGTIRSRTHHYPFRLVAPAAMLEYVEQLCAQEGVRVEPGVLPLVVRAGGGSPRDTLSVLDQLIAGSEDSAVTYARAVALLGYTPAELLDEVVDAFGGQDAAAAFAAIDRVVQTGQDPRRFVDDLLERLRDLIVVAATGDGAAAVLRGIPAEELERMSRQAAVFGAHRLSRIADIVVAALDEMTGATSPRLQLELMVARVLARGAAAESHLAAVAPAMPQPAAAPAAPAPATPQPSAVTAAPQPDAAPATPQPVTATPQPDAAPAPVAERGPQPHDEAPAPAAPAEPRGAPAGPVTLERIEHAWPDILVMLEGIDRTSWLVATTARVADFAGDVLTLSFGSATDVAKFKKLQAGKGPSEDLRQAIQTVLGVRVKYIARHGGGPAGPAGGHGDGPAPPDADPAPDPAPQVAAADPASAPRTASPAAGAPPAAPVTDWAVVAIPQGSPSDESPAPLAVDDEPEDAASAAIRTATLAPPREGDVLPARDVQTSAAPDEDDPDETDLDIADVPVVATPLPASSVRGGGVERVGEAVVRQILGARFVREEPYESPTRFQ